MAPSVFAVVSCFTPVKTPKAGLRVMAANTSAQANV
jgi:hypothetical protein